MTETNKAAAIRLLEGADKAMGYGTWNHALNLMRDAARVLGVKTEWSDKRGTWLCEAPGQKPLERLTDVGVRKWLLDIAEAMPEPTRAVDETAHYRCEG